MKTPLPALFLFFAAHLAAQPLLSWRHYSLDDGLPDNTFYTMTEDAQGFLWFTTNAGICRFDGYEFRQFPAPDEVNSISTFLPQTDAQGRVWFCTANQKLYFFENDSIHAWKHNHLLDQFKGKVNIGTNFGFRPDGSVLLMLPNIGFLLVQPDGSHEVLDGDFKTNLAAEFDWGFRASPPRGTAQSLDFQTKNYFSKNLSTPIVLLLQNGRRDTVPALPTSISGDGIGYGFRPGKDSLLLFAPHDVWFLVKNRLVRQLSGDPKAPAKTFAHFQRHADGRFYLSRIKAGAGLYIYSSLEGLLSDSPAEVLLPGIDVSSTWLDRQGGLWVTTLKQGVFYRSNANISIWNQKTACRPMAFRTSPPTAKGHCSSAPPITTFFASVCRATASGKYPSQKKTCTSITCFSIPSTSG